MKTTTSAVKTSPKATPKAKAPTKAQLAKAAEIFGEKALNEVVTEVIASQEQVVTEEVAVPAKPNAMDFAVQQLSTPTVLTDEQKVELQKALDAVNSKFGVVVAPVTQKVQRNKIAQNGITRPGETTKCGQIFAVADAITTKTGFAATISAVKAACPGINDHTVKTQYARWRQFNGITGRLAVPQAAKGSSGVVADPLTWKL